MNICELSSWALTVELKAEAEAGTCTGLLIDAPTVCNTKSPSYPWFSQPIMWMKLKNPKSSINILSYSPPISCLLNSLLSLHTLLSKTHPHSRFFTNQNVAMLPFYRNKEVNLKIIMLVAPNNFLPIAKSGW